MLVVTKTRHNRKLNKSWWRLLIEFDNLLGVMLRLVRQVFEESPNWVIVLHHPVDQFVLGFKRSFCNIKVNDRARFICRKSKEGR